MKKEIKIVDKEKGILQVTTVDERWYIRQSTDKATGLPIHEYVPSVTWICEHYPKGIAYYKWLANKGWDEAEAIKEAAGDKGGKVHQAVALLIDGQTVKIDQAFINPRTEQVEPLTLEEYEAAMSFVEWVKAAKPKFLRHEFVVFEDAFGYAGMVDLECEIGGELYIVDFKTSAYIWPSHELQVSAYKEAVDKLGDLENVDKEVKGHKLAILQLGYRLNKTKKFKFTEIEDKFTEFMAARTIWANETKGVEPKQKDYPLEICLNPVGTAEKK